MITSLSHYSTIDDSLDYLGDASLGEDNLLQLQLYSMGGAVIGNDGKMYVHPQSDRKEAHQQEARVMKKVVNNYLDSKVGKAFTNYVKQQGKKFTPIVGIGTEDLGENTVAALRTNDLEAVLLSNYDGKGIEKRALEMAQAYGILDTQMMLDYVITHELAHAAGYKSEADTERFVGQFYTNLAQRSTGKEQEKYLVLAAVAGMRAEEAGKKENN
ncbi:MAG: hypothetical protein WCV90_00430 [Candidatus Woesearchaeota archaeon]